MKSLHSTLTTRAGALFRAIKTRLTPVWSWYRARPTWQQRTIGLLLAALLIGGLAWANSAGTDESTPKDRTVTLASVASLSSNGSGASLYGTVRSVTEAQLLAQTGGTVKSVRTRLGATVPAGYVIAELDNASEAAAVLQAEGAYDAAIAARNAQSLSDTRMSGRDAYRSTYTTLDTILENQVDQLFGTMTAYGPQFRVLADGDESRALSRERQRIDGLIRQYESNLATADSRSPQALLDEAENVARQTQTFLNRVAAAANDRGSNATAAELSALTSARASIDGALSNITAARASLRSGTVSATASADATVKQALGSLRAAQANYEKTRVRATIGGTVNFLPIKVGEYVTSFTHVATVAQNGALEIVAYVPEDDRDAVSVGMQVGIEGDYTGIITAVAPALDPTTKQIEVRIAVQNAPELVNGQSVRITLPGMETEEPSLTEAQGPILLPLAAVKLRADERIVFTVDGEGRLAGYPVEIGEVRGNRIEIISALPRDLMIVADARGLSEGQRVTVEHAGISTE